MDMVYCYFNGNGVVFSIKSPYSRYSLLTKTPRQMTLKITTSDQKQAKQKSTRIIVKQYENKR
jgi:hypothetical protein